MLIYYFNAFNLNFKLHKFNYIWCYLTAKISTTVTKEVVDTDEKSII